MGRAEEERKGAKVGRDGIDRKGRYKRGRRRRKTENISFLPIEEREEISNYILLSVKEEKGLYSHFFSFFYFLLSDSEKEGLPLLSSASVMNLMH